MFFCFPGLDEASEQLFARADRLLTLGGPACWKLIREPGSSRANPTIRNAKIDASQRLHLGQLQWSPDGLDWRPLRSDILADLSTVNGPLRFGNELVGLSTIGPESMDLTRYRVWSGPLSPGQLLLDLGATNTDRIQNLLDQELPHLAAGRIPWFIQDGLSDIEALAWLARLLSLEADSRSSVSSPTVVLTGSDGNGWHLVPLHGLNARKEKPVMPLPHGMTKLRFEGWMGPTPGPWSRRLSAQSACAVLRGEGNWNADTFDEGKCAATVLPLLLSSDILIDDRPDNWNGPLWVVQAVDRINVDNRETHEIELLVCKDPAALFSSTIPADAPKPGGTYWVEVGESADGVPDWTVPCRFVRLEGPVDVDVLLSTLYSGYGQAGGLHFVPEHGTIGLVHWTGRLSEPPILLSQPRPVKGEKKRNSGASADVRKLGQTAVQLLGKRELVVQLPAFRTTAENDVTLQSRNGNIRLERKQGRVLQIGKSHVDIDPKGGPG